eukprot:CAMPEP_0172641596 /NCGR_PEP_ID=MMETSP1068-20121228/228100_1 /TAXON_ID=35684 /ORGANISM="Pseudopedinella elastica, Strain CCMP716" /LENGTH=151 /DNA_ID=CAMNT_0013455219 /DNA_START=33 /DNA_END=485 /DNA_ORIENTATION=+
MSAESEFMSLTGADLAVALNYLEMAGGNVETAVNLFLEMGGVQSSNAPAMGGFGDGSGNGAMANVGPGAGGGLLPSDAGLGGLGPMGGLGGGYDDEVRAPDAASHGRLVDDAPSLEANQRYGASEPVNQVHAFRDFGREADHAAVHRARKK